jgi:hypothetical protein
MQLHPSTSSPKADEKLFDEETVIENDLPRCRQGTPLLVDEVWIFDGREARVVAVAKDAA